MITVFGSINMDLVATAKRLPKPGETVTGETFATAAGGKGANQALAATRAGVKVRMAGAVGDDTFAEPALALLRHAHTNLELVKSAPGATGTAVILIGEGGENVIVVIPAANGTVTAADASAALEDMQRGDILMLQFEVPTPAIETALIEAKARGIITLINTAPLIADAPRIARLADIVIANETEFELLLGKEKLSSAERESALRTLHDITGQTVIVTLGADGVIAMRDSQFFKATGLLIDPVDTVGAGDTFCGYLAAGLDQGLEFSVALKRAAVAGSLACTKHGAQPSIPLVLEVEARL